MRNPPVKPVNVHEDGCNVTLSVVGAPPNVKSCPKLSHHNPELNSRMAIRTGFTVPVYRVPVSAMVPAIWVRERTVELVAGEMTPVTGTF
ncbi:MAG: hypothetical protein KCHDKBKB_02386 [Elusimicrobia bacterium]|nr:hypothetical protein [Elusimicrobiota bacterium]